jgi:type IV fimbrial biogenesis protein FimT
MKPNQYKKHQCRSGFTLIELLVTLSIATTLITFAASAFNNFIQQITLTNAINALHSAMNLARMEAIKRNGRVDLIARDGSWKHGWIITANDQLIFSHEALHKDILIDSTFTSKVKPYIAYNGTGRTCTDDNSNRPQIGTIRMSIGEHARLIVVNFLGRVRICNPKTAPAGTCIFRG